MAKKRDLVTQIEADLKGKTEPAGVLRERLKRVRAAKSDAAAERAYFKHLAENGPAE